MKLQHTRLSKTAVKRLLQLCDFMETLPKKLKNFDMSTYYHAPGNITNVTKKTLLSCGTQACALGWAAAAPALQKQGLAASWQPGSVSFKLNKKEQEGPEEAAQAFFDIDEDQAYYLFGAHMPEGGEDCPHEWARQCRYFVQTDGLAPLA